MSTFRSNSSGSDPRDQGVVKKIDRGIYHVTSGGCTVQCILSSMAHENGTHPATENRRKPSINRQSRLGRETTPVTIGDEVCFLYTRDGEGMIVEVLPRRNKLSRRGAVPMPGAHAFEQVIAANLDQVIPVFAAANPAPKWNMLDRYLVLAEQAGLPALICITKLDLVRSVESGEETDLWQALEEYCKIGYPVVLTSTATQDGLTELKQALHGRSSVFLGKSGVGKTSLLNALQPGLGLRVNDVSQVTGKGKHTTSNLEMFQLEFGGSIIDTPGVHEFGLWDVDQSELSDAFPEMRAYLGRCKFGAGCQHDEEPGCAVRKAVMAGQISPRRYQSYIRLREDL